MDTEPGTTAYVLMTPARNEAAFIERTLLSVVNQTLRPLAWVVVDDGSSDETAEIVARYAREHDFIHLVQASGEAQRSFGSKAKVLERAYEKLQQLADFDFVGNLDADISFDPGYFAWLSERFERDPSLGIAGGVQYQPRAGRWELYHQSSNSVTGPIQFFRRRCYDEIGGYRALPFGGIDAAAEFTARSSGWTVQSFTERGVYHHRPTGSANQTFNQALYKAGKRDRTLGYDPLFIVLRAGQLAAGNGGRPLSSLRAGLSLLAGYLVAFARRVPFGIDPEVRRFVRAEQRSRIIGLIRSRRDPVERHTSIPRTIPDAPYGH